MGALNYIPFHDTLTQGDKRGLSRATRFIFLELTLHAKPYGGRLPLPRGFKTDLDAVEDIIGGNRRELAAALATLTVPIDPTDPEERPMIAIEGPPQRRVLVVVSYAEWSPTGPSTPRVRKYRNKRREQSQTDEAAGNAFHPVSETVDVKRDETGQREEKGKEEKETPVVPQGGPGMVGVTDRGALPPVPASEGRMWRDLWIRAYVGGVVHGGAAPGWTFQPKTFSTLERVVSARCPIASRDNIPRWIAHQASRFSKAAQANPTKWSAFSADGFERWWNAGCPVEGRLGGPQPVASEPADELVPPAAPAERVSEERLAEIRSGNWQRPAKAGES